MSSRGFVGLETLSCQMLEPSAELLLSHGQADVPREGLLSRELRSRAVFVPGGCHPASLKAQKLPLVPALPGQA